MALGSESLDSSKFCLKWDGFHNNITSVFENLRQDGELVDITLCCEGRKLKAHKMMLSASSPFFRDLLKENPCQHPVFVLRDTRCADVAAILEFVYRGSVNVSQTQLGSFIQTAELLQIRGLSGDDEPKQNDSRSPPSHTRPARAEPTTVRDGSCPSPATPSRPPSPGVRPTTPPVKRRRLCTPPPPAPAPPVAAPCETPHGRERPEPAQLAQAAPPPDGVKLEKVEVLDVDDDSLTYERPGDALELMFPLPPAPARDRGVANPSPSLVQSVATTPASVIFGDDSSPAAASSARGSFQCPVCQQKYSSVASLNNHISLHRGNTVCPICGKTCSTTSNRNRHMATKHALVPSWRLPLSGGDVNAGGDRGDPGSNGRLWGATSGSSPAGPPAGVVGTADSESHRQVAVHVPGRQDGSAAAAADVGGGRLSFVDVSDVSSD